MDRFRLIRKVRRSPKCRAFHFSINRLPDAARASCRASAAAWSLPDRQCIFFSRDRKQGAGSNAWTGLRVCNWRLIYALLRYLQQATDRFQSLTEGPACAGGWLVRYAIRFWVRLNPRGIVLSRRLHLLQCVHLYPLG